MKRLLISSMLLALTAIPMSAQARNYDCSKAGNATKAACKGAAVAPAAAVTVKASPPKTMASAATVRPAAKPTADRTYDCSKAGNANKAVCKGAATPSATPVSSAPKPAAATPATHTMAAAKPVAHPGAPTVAWTTKTGKVVHYDCAKAGNQSKQACKG